MKILIAEDDLTSRTMLAALATKWGYDAIAVEDGEEAWKVLQGDDPPRLLLLDWMMPNLDGVGLCKRIRQNLDYDPPFIILLSARNEVGDIVKGLETGANEYISKPISNAELLARLRVGERMLDLQSELKQVQQALTYQAYHDALTGLLNRRAIMEALSDEVKRSARESNAIGVGMCDIDHFKEVNDIYGHQAGDAILAKVAECIKSTLRPYDKAGRYGGEEFLIILNIQSDDVFTPFERIRLAVESTPFLYKEFSIPVTISCGATLCVSATDYRESDALIGAADIALYQAKHAGRNRTVFN